MAVWWGARPRGDSGDGTGAGLAVFVPDGGRAGQADGLALGSYCLIVITTINGKLIAKFPD